MIEQNQRQKWFKWITERDKDQKVSAEADRKKNFEAIWFESGGKGWETELYSGSAECMSELGEKKKKQKNNIKIGPWMIGYK